MTSTNGMFVIVYGPAAEMDEESEAVRREKVSSQPELSAPPFAAGSEPLALCACGAAAQRSARGQVVADEPGCLLYQLVKNGDGEYFVFELYKDQCAAAPSSAPMARGCGLQA